MDAVLALFLDGGLAEHWPDAALAALFAFVVWLLQRWISAGDRRDQELEKESRKQGDKIVDHEVRITVIEKTPKERYRE